MKWRLIAQQRMNSPLFSSQPKRPKWRLLEAKQKPSSPLVRKICAVVCQLKLICLQGKPRAYKQREGGRVCNSLQSLWEQQNLLPVTIHRNFLPILGIHTALLKQVCNTDGKIYLEFSQWLKAAAKVVLVEKSVACSRMTQPDQLSVDPAWQTGALLISAQARGCKHT